jgi:hypothetical protein
MRDILEDVAKQPACQSGRAKAVARFPLVVGDELRYGQGGFDDEA